MGRVVHSGLVGFSYLYVAFLCTVSCGPITYAKSNAKRGTIPWSYYASLGIVLEKYRCAPCHSVNIQDTHKSKKLYSTGLLLTPLYLTENRKESSWNWRPREITTSDSKWPTL